MRAGSQHSVKAGSGVPESAELHSRRHQSCCRRRRGGGGGREVEGGKRMVMMRLALTGICPVLSQVVFRAINSANH